MRMKVTSDIDCHKILTGPEMNHGDFPFRFMIKIEYSEHHSEELAKEVGKYIVNLSVVSPSEARTTEAYQSALNSCGWTEEQVKQWGPYAEYEMLLEHGTAARLWESSGNNLKALMKECRAKLAESNLFFGFAMDRANNRIGTTGWDAVKGDILAPLHRHQDTPEGKLMQKLHGIES